MIILKDITIRERTTSLLSVLNKLAIFFLERCVVWFPVFGEIGECEGVEVWIFLLGSLGEESAETPLGLL